MFAKRLIFFALFLSFALLIGHDVIPHAHFDEHDLECHDSHSDHHDEDEAGDNFNLFSFVTHADAFVSEPVSELAYYKIAVVVPSLRIFKICTLDIEVPPKIPESSATVLLESIFSCSCLRAPPYLFS